MADMTMLAAVAVGADAENPLGTKDDLAALLRFCARSGVRPVVDSVFPLADARDALARLASGAQFGKVVVTVP